MLGHARSDTVQRAEQRTGEISVISSSGGTPHPLTSGPALQPSLSPDGRRLAFVSDQIRVMSTDGSGQRPVGTANGERQLLSGQREVIVIL